MNIPRRLVGVPLFLVSALMVAVWNVAVLATMPSRRAEVCLSIRKAFYWSFEEDITAFGFLIWVWMIFAAWIYTYPFFQVLHVGDAMDGCLEWRVSWWFAGYGIAAFVLTVSLVSGNGLEVPKGWFVVDEDLL